VTRAVVDPGVLIAALLSPKGSPAGVVVAWLEGRFELIVSRRLLSELQSVLLRNKFRPSVSREEVLAYVELFERFSAVTLDPSTERGVTPDPDDDYLVSLARSAQADFLVSGDSHLTRLRNLRPPVLNPKAFLDLVRKDR
jgi:putative PIN family toxin of toxin-antitoxin system